MQIERLKPLVAPTAATRLLSAIGVALGTLVGSPSWAQVDSAARPHQLEEKVVVAHRTPTLLRESIAATTVLDRVTLERLPARTLADALSYVPGLTFTARDGTGQLPMAVARGFFGGGETDYVLLTVDGIPVNDLRTGLAEWTQIPLAAIERVEVLRGGASSAYGDAALGAVVNVVTRDPEESRRLSSDVELGGWGDLGLQSFLARPVGTDRFDAGIAASRVDGFRSHARATNVAVSGQYVRHPISPTAAYARASVQHLTNQEPGPISPEQIARDPSVANPLFASDQRRRTAIELGAGLARAPVAGRLAADVRIRLLDDDQTRTLPLSTDAGDTQFLDARSWDLWSRLQYSRRFGASTILAGVEAERGGYSSRYADALDQRVVLSSGDGERTKIAQFIELQHRIGSRLKGVAGGRFDLVALAGPGTEQSSPHFSQWSPRLGLNFAYASGATHSGNIYLTWTRSFKAPTAYQLYDVRLIRTGEPGESINLSNPDLRPQHSSGVELGVYHRLALWGTAFADLTLAAYRMDVSDEIDFDLRTFRYGNILRSRHDGLEASLTASLSPALSLRHAFTLMHATSRTGDQPGKRLKNMPEIVATTGVQLSVAKNLELGLTHHLSGGLFLDDANLEPLPGSHRVDALVTWGVGPAQLQLMVVNLGDSHASNGGFMVYDPERGGNVRLLYPEAGRYLRAGVTVLR
jgi:vitamin B12 transporter